jgi:hypothetical protein
MLKDMPMKFVGNYSSWMTEQKIMEYLSACQWEPYSLASGLDTVSGHPILEKIRKQAEPWYSNDKAFFHMLGPHSPEMKTFNFDLPSLPETRKEINWWFVKLYPGEFQCMHVDAHTINVKNLVRYTIFLQDWEPGHIFVLDNEYVANYRAGDMYEWSDPLSLHAPANIGYNPRYTFQITLNN